MYITIAETKRPGLLLQLGAAIINSIPQKPLWPEEHCYPSMRLSSWVAANGVGFINTLPAMQAARLEKEGRPAALLFE